MVYTYGFLFVSFICVVLLAIEVARSEWWAASLFGGTLLIVLIFLADALRNGR